MGLENAQMADHEGPQGKAGLGGLEKERVIEEAMGLDPVC